MTELYFLISYQENEQIYVESFIQVSSFVWRVETPLSCGGKEFTYGI